MKLPTSLPWILWAVSRILPAQTLVIGLYDYADLSATETARLTETAGLAFAHSGVHVIWRHCRGVLTTPPACEGELQANQIVVRLEPRVPGSTGDDRTLRLGNSAVTAEGGHYATAFVPAVRAQAQDFGVAFDLLLGYAVAHEAGHCVLGGAHSNGGLMRATWNRKDALEMSRLSLNLTKQEGRKAAARLAGNSLARR